MPYDLVLAGVYVKQAIWLIAGGAMQSVAARKVKSLGYHLILSDGNPHAFCRELADKFLTIDTFDSENHIRAAQELKDEYTIVAVFTMSADCHGTVARLAQFLGVHHIDPKISEICRDKYATRKLLRAAGLRQPESYLVSSYEEAQKILGESSHSFVLKATDNSGSRGFTAIDPTKGLSLEQFLYTVSMGTTDRAILEERLEPDPEQISEASVETIWSDGEMYWLNWVDRIFPRDLKFFPQVKIGSIVDGIEVGHINPARHEPETKAQVLHSMYLAGKALCMDQQKGGHFLKGDLFFSTNGPVILELTPRSSGGWDSCASSIERGADIASGIIHMALGKPLDLAAWDRFFRFKNEERTAVVMAKIPDNAVDCIGREYAIASGNSSIDTVMNDALNRLTKGEYLVSVR